MRKRNQHIKPSAATLAATIDNVREGKWPGKRPRARGAEKEERSGVEGGTSTPSGAEASGCVLWAALPLTTGGPRRPELHNNVVETVKKQAEHRPKFASFSKHKIGWNSKWQVEFPWLVPVHEEGEEGNIVGMLCATCRRHHQAQWNGWKCWASEPVASLRRDVVKKHANSFQHREAEKKELSRLALEVDGWSAQAFERESLQVLVQERMSATLEDFLLRAERGGGELAHDVPVLRVRIAAAAEDIVGLVEERVAEYRDRVEQSEREIAHQRRLLDAILKPGVGLHRADVQRLMVTNEEDFSQQQQSPRLDLEDSTAAQVKVELEEAWISQEGQHPQSPDKSEIIKVTLTHVAVKSEDEEEKPPLSQFLQTEENGEKRGGTESARNSSPDGHIEPGPEKKTSYSYFLTRD